MTLPDTGNSPPAQNRRRFKSHLVNRDVRLRLVLDDAVFALVAALAAIFILYFLSNREIGDSMYSAHLSLKETRELLTNGVKIAGVVTFIAVMLFGFWSLIDAHRIAGPMHRLHRLLREIAEGDLTKEIKFRKRDEFQEIAAAADRMVDVLEQRVGAALAHTRALAQLAAAESISSAQQQELRSTLARLDAELSFFRLAPGAPSIDGSAFDARAEAE